MIRFLHLSDLHLRANGYAEGGESGRALRALVNTVRKRRDRNPDLNLHLVFVTGDLACTGGNAECDSEDGFKDSEYGSVRDFLVDLMDASDLPMDRLWIVPGNHDVIRSRAAFVTDIAPLASEFCTKPGRRAQFSPQYTGYLNLHDKLYGSSASLASGDVVREPKVVSIDGTKVAIIPMNSSWVATNDEDRGRLWVCRQLLMERLHAVDRDSPQVKLVLMHHPLAWLHDDDDFKTFAVHNCDMLLRGHLHSPDIQQIYRQGQAMLDVGAGATYLEAMKGPLRVYFGRLQGEPKRFALCPYTFVQSEPAYDVWVADSTVFPGKECETYPPVESDTPVKSVPLPWSVPEDATSNDWASQIVAWVLGVEGSKAGEYWRDQSLVFRTLVQHLVDVLRFSQNRPGAKALGEKVEQLAREMLDRLARDAWKKHCGSSVHGGVSPPESSALRRWFESLEGKQDLVGWMPAHIDVLMLLSRGVHENLSHFFMLPLVDVDALLEKDGYVPLLLATRLHAEGEYDQARDLVSKSRAKDCCLGKYLYAQCLRQMHWFDPARNVLRQILDQVLPLIKTGDYFCGVSSDNACMCDSGLFEAEVERALAVVLRKEKKYDEAREHYSKASLAIPAPNILQMKSRAACVSNSGRLCGSFEKGPLQVAADVHFSYGYFLYEHLNSQSAGELFKEAEEQFNRSIVLTETAEAIWDPPWTRRAILRFLQGRKTDARADFEIAKDLCRRSSRADGSQVELSGALIELGLSVIDLELGGATSRKPILVLTDCLSGGAKFGIGPVDCHRHDALKLAGACASAKGRELGEEFAEHLQTYLAKS